MSGDIRSIVLVKSYIKPDAYGSGTRTVDAIDTGLYNSFEIFVDAGTFGASATLTNKLQYSADGSTGWIDDDGSSGNTPAPAALTAEGTQHFRVVSPKERFYRLSSVSAVQTIDYGAVLVADPKDKPPA